MEIILSENSNQTVLDDSDYEAESDSDNEINSNVHDFFNLKQINLLFI